jgi:pyruvate dehydrogenase E1 component
MGDGEMDEPESMGAISLAGREKLDNLIFVINCNLQRLDGPVRGNGKIIQELETNFRGAGWNVIKVIWGSRWDELLEADKDGILMRRMEEAVDGDYQAYKSRDGAFVREHFFGTSPELAAMVEDWTDDEIWALNRGGHDAARSARRTRGRAPQGPADRDPRQDDQGLRDGRGRRGPEHHPPAEEDEREALFAFRDRFELDLTDDEVREIAFHKPADDSPEMTYLRERREALGGSLPQRRTTAPELAIPELSAFKGQLEGTGEREISTTMAFVRILSTLVRDKQLGPHIVPIVPDESRTFGMEGMFRQLGIFSQVGQLYTPRTPTSSCPTRRTRRARSSRRASTSRALLELDRRGDLVREPRRLDDAVLHLLLDVRLPARGRPRVGGRRPARARLLIGGTAGRTTLNGEGLQHEDGHSHIQASLIPNCVAYDPRTATSSR